MPSFVCCRPGCHTSFQVCICLPKGGPCAVMWLKCLPVDHKDTIQGWRIHLPESCLPTVDSFASSSELNPLWRSCLFSELGSEDQRLALLPGPHSNTLGLRLGFGVDTYVAEQNMWGRGSVCTGVLAWHWNPALRQERTTPESEMAWLKEVHRGEEGWAVFSWLVRRLCSSTQTCFTP